MKSIMNGSAWRVCAAAGLVVALAGCDSTPQNAANDMSSAESSAESSSNGAAMLPLPANRVELERVLQTAEANFQAGQTDETRRAYAQALFLDGDIWRARETIAPLATLSSDIAVDLLIGAKAALYLNDLDEAERLYERLFSLVDEDSELYEEALIGLMLVYYQAQDFDKADKLPKLPDETEKKQSLITLMQALEGVPYEIEWTTPEKIAHIPFTNDIWEPGILPVSSISLNGREFEFILDTGGDLLYLDDSLVEEAGLKIIGQTQNKYTYTDGEYVDERYGVAESIEFAGVIVRNVPIHTTTLKDRGIEEDGIITTGLLKQFLSTIDYDKNEITLRPRTQAARNELLANIGDQGVIGIPFYMAGTHLMMAKGTLNDRDNINMFMDSGLAMSMPGIVSNETAELFELEKNSVEGTEYYWSPLNQFGLNKVKHGRGNALGNTFVNQDLYWKLGFAFDALLSHNYLLNLGSWSIDFDEMAFYFPGKAAHQGMAMNADEPEKVRIKVANTDPYVGGYEVAPGVILEITGEDGVVYLQAPGQQRIGMEAYDDGTFGIPLAGASIVFQGDPESGITGLEMTQGSNVTVAEKK